jgi:hypothetical protein
MFLWLGTAKSTRRIKGGRKERAFCPECDEQTSFVEVEVEEKVLLFSVIDFLGDKQRAFRCQECDSVGQLVDQGDLSAGVLEDLSPEAAERLERARAAERASHAAAEREKMERDRRQREQRADDELLELKARMGLLPAPSGHDRDDDCDDAPDDAPPKPRSWRLWRR